MTDSWLLLVFFHVDSLDKDPEDRLYKVRFLHDIIRNRCRELYQPHSHIAVDERMIRFKGRHAMRVYLKSKPTKWGFKSYALCDSESSYIWNFELYTGQHIPPGPNGLTYDLVIRLLEPLLDQGYTLFTDNYYTSQALATTLLQCNTHLVGTVRSNRTGFPAALKNTKQFERYGERGDIRYVRDDNVVCTQWLDNKVVTLLSTKHRATDRHDAERMVKENGAWVAQPVRRPIAVAHYNEFMGGVDTFDQLATSYHLLRRSKKSWKPLFYDLIECAIVNSFILMEQFKKENPGALPHNAGFCQARFRENLCR